ncbi:hypothetical protein VULLAG_LOCUS9795 [Vulpes lagopus]
MVSERTTLEAFRPASRTQKTTRLRQVRIAKRSYSEPPFHRPHTEARGAATYSGLPKLGSGGGEGGVGPGQNCLAQRGPGYYYTPWKDTDAAEANSRRTAPGTCHGGASGPAGSSPSRTTTPSNLRRASWSTSGERPPLSTAEVRRSLRLWGRRFCRSGGIGRTGKRARRRDSGNPGGARADPAPALSAPASRSRFRWFSRLRARGRAGPAGRTRGALDVGPGAGSRLSAPHAFVFPAAREDPRCPAGRTLERNKSRTPLAERARAC